MIAASLSPDGPPLDDAEFALLMAALAPWPIAPGASAPETTAGATGTAAVGATLKACPGATPVTMPTAAAPPDSATAAMPAPAAPTAATLAVAVSGGADSLCLAMLAAGWAVRAGLSLLALVVDHGLRPQSGREARQAIARLEAHGIAAHLLTLDGLEPGPGLAERARLARYAALRGACREAGAVDLLLGHHAFDQAETVLMRRGAASGPDGLAGMASVLELDDVRLLRPLLPIPPARLRATLRDRGVGWIEDPSNRDQRAERTRARDTLSRDPELRQVLCDHAAQAGREREQRRAGEASLLAQAVGLRPEGFALLPPELVPAGAMAALIRTVGGRPHRASAEAIEALLHPPRPATLAGTQLLPAGRLGAGWMLVREADAMQGAVPAVAGVRWDGRFVLCGPVPEGDGLLVAAVGAQAAVLRRCGALPAVVLRTLPSLRSAEGALLAVPHLGWTAGPGPERVRFRFQPPAPASDSSAFTVWQPFSAMPERSDASSPYGAGVSSQSS